MFERWDADQFLEEIDDDQFRKWKAFAEVEPFGPWADDLRNGMQMAQYANIKRDRSKRKEPFAALDFQLSKVKPPSKHPVPPKVRRERMTVALGKPTRVFKLGQH